MTDNQLTYDAEPGTELKIQSTDRPERFYTGIVNEDGLVVDPNNQAIFNSEHYNIVGEN